MKALLPILALFIGCNIALGQTPCTNDCNGSTNDPIYIQPIPLDALQLRIRPAEIGLSNTLPHNLYQLEGSTNLLDWIPLTGRLTNTTGAEKVFSWTNDFNNFTGFRARDVTWHWEVEEPLLVSSSGTCAGGSYIGRVAYYRDYYWGYPVDTNTAVHIFGDYTRTNTRIEYIGRYGDTGCGTGFVSITNPPSPEYRFEFFFTSDMPDTNVDYVAIMRGFVP